MEHLHWQTRTKMMLDEDAMKKLASVHVLVAGLGGVGAYAAEQLVRCGVGEITIADSDQVQETNINRQLMALHSTVGKKKVDLYAERFLDINPTMKIHTFDEFIQETSARELLSKSYDYVIDAIDTLSPKISLIMHAVNQEFPLISSMGAGGRFDPFQIQVDDFWNTKYCRLAYYLRKILRRLKVEGAFKAVYSTEQVNKSYLKETLEEKNKKAINGTISYLPPIFGCICASVVIRDLTGN